MANAIYKQYKIVTADTLTLLEMRVNSWCEDFWNPLGPPIIEQFGTVKQYYQAMVRDKSKFVA